MLRQVLRMIRTPFNRVIASNGGTPYAHLEQLMLPIVVRDLTPMIEGLHVPVDQGLVIKSLRGELPAGWTFVNRYPRTPQAHMIYNGDGLKGTVMEGQKIDVFFCIVTTQKDRDEVGDSQSGLYVLDLPLLNEEADRPGNFALAPLSNPAAWITLFVYGKEKVECSWRMSHSIMATIRVDGEVNYEDLD